MKPKRYLIIIYPTQRLFWISSSKSKGEELNLAINKKLNHTSWTFLDHETFPHLTV